MAGNRRLPWVTPLGSETLIGAMQAAAEAAGYPFLLLIDALNESDDARAWRRELPSLVHVDINTITYKETGICGRESPSLDLTKGGEEMPRSSPYVIVLTPKDMVCWKPEPVDIRYRIVT